MKIWLLTQSVNNDYDTFDSCLVIAPTAEEAKKINPDGDIYPQWSQRPTWAFTPEEVTAEVVGETNQFPSGTVIIASFNAG